MSTPAHDPTYVSWDLMSSLQVPLPVDRLDQLRQLARRSGTTVEDLVRQAVEEWLDAVGEQAGGQWQQRLSELLDRRASGPPSDPAEVDRDVADAVSDVRGRASSR